MKLPWPRWRQRLTRRRLVLRQATAKDLDELDRLYESCMRVYAEQLYPWDPHSFRDTFVPEQIEVLEFQDEIVAILKTEVRQDHLYLAEVQVAESYRNLGLGTRLILLTMERATVVELPIRLRVLSNNPAKALYEKLGFCQIAEGAFDRHLEWCPSEQ